MNKLAFINKIFRLYRYTQYTRRLFIRLRTKRLVHGSRIVEYAWVSSHLAGSQQILDVGSTGSLFPFQMASLGYQVSVLDARNYLEWHGLKHPNMTLFEGDIADMPFFPEMFDTVTAISTIEHMGSADYFDNPLVGNKDVIGIREIHRVLQPSGKLLLTLPHVYTGKKTLPFTRKTLPFTRVYDPETIRCRLFQNLSLFSIQQEEYFKLQNGFWDKTDGFTGKEEGLCCILAIKE